MSRSLGFVVQDVEKHYATPAGFVRAIDGITLDVAPGSSLAIMGPSGCGKSTLLALIGGLDTPTRGRVVIGDREISRMPDGARAEVRRRDMGLVYQSDNLLPFLTAVENVALQLSLHGCHDGYERSTELLRSVGLGDRLGALPDQLSRGQRQRVAVARALVHRPGLVLADEPTGSLDHESANALVALLRDAQRESGATLVVVTHDPWTAKQLDRTVPMRDGRLASDATGMSVT